MDYQFDALDKKLEQYFYGFVTKKSLTYYFKNITSIPIYVLEYLLGLHCISEDEDEVQRGLERVQEILSANYVKRSDFELIKSRIKEQGSYVIIDKIEARLDETKDTYIAEFMNFDIIDFYIPSDYVTRYEKLLTGGIWVIAKLKYLPGGIRSQIEFMDDLRTKPLSKKFFEPLDSPFIIESIEPIQMPSIDFEDIYEYRKNFTLDEWIDVIIRSIGYESEQLDFNSKLHMIQRLVPLAEKNYNLCELGPRSTGKSFIYKEISPYSILVSGGYASTASLFFNLARNSLGLVGTWDCVAFDEVAGIHYKDLSVIQTMKDYMTAGSFTRGTNVLSGEASLVFIGNVNESLEQMKKVSHLFAPFPEEFRDDAAFFDRIHAYLPGWEIPKLKAAHFTNHYGFISDYISEFLKRSREKSNLTRFNEFFKLNKCVNKRDEIAIQKTVSGMLKILFPDQSETKDDIEIILKYAIQNRRRVKEQLDKMVGQEFQDIHLGYIDNQTSEHHVVETNDVTSTTLISVEETHTGQVYGVGYNVYRDSIGIFKLDNKAVLGEGKFKFERVYMKQTKEMLTASYELFKEKSRLLFPSYGLTSFDYFTTFIDSQNSGESDHIAVAALCGFASALLKKVIIPGLVICGNFNLAGIMEETPPLHDVFRIAKNAGAHAILLPESALIHYDQISDYYKSGIRVIKYKSPADAVLLALGEKHGMDI